MPKPSTLDPRFTTSPRRGPGYTTDVMAARVAGLIVFAFFVAMVVGLYLVVGFPPGH